MEIPNSCPIFGFLREISPFRRHLIIVCSYAPMRIKKRPMNLPYPSNPLPLPFVPHYWVTCHAGWHKFRRIKSQIAKILYRSANQMTH